MFPGASSPMQGSRIVDAEWGLILALNIPGSYEIRPRLLYSMTVHRPSIASAAGRRMGNTAFVHVQLIAIALYA